MISICIPVYNQDEFLPEAIESALDQTLKTEVIVVNDGSTDNSLEIAKLYETRGVKVINQVNKGLPSARNTAIMNMTGDYFLPLDADDILMETCIEKIQGLIDATQCDVIAPSFKCFGISNREVVLNAIPNLEDFKSANRLGYFSAIKKSVLQEVGGYNPKMAYGFEDWDLWFDIFKRGKNLAVTPEILVLYRTKEKSMYTEALGHADTLYKQIQTNHPEIWGQK